jgi:hypothetical protein
MGAQKGLKRATLKFTKTQLPAVLEARKKNKHMKIKAKQALQTKANLQAKGAGSRRCQPQRAASRLLPSTQGRACTLSRRAGAAPAPPRRARLARADISLVVHCVCVQLHRLARAASRSLTRAASPPRRAQLRTPPPLRRPRSAARRT